MNTPVQMASEDTLQAKHHDHVSQDNMKQQIKQDLSHDAQGQGTSLNAIGRKLVNEVIQPEVGCGNPVDMEIRPHTIPKPVQERPHRRRSRRSRRKPAIMARHNSRYYVPGARARASSSFSYSGGHRVRRSSNSNISAIGVNPKIAIAPDPQGQEQVIHHPVVDVPVEPPVVLFERGFLPNWENKMNLSNPGALTMHPAVFE